MAKQTRYEYRPKNKPQSVEDQKVDALLKEYPLTQSTIAEEGVNYLIYKLMDPNLDKQGIEELLKGAQEARVDINVVLKKLKTLNTPGLLDLTKVIEAGDNFTKTTSEAIDLLNNSAVVAETNFVMGQSWCHELEKELGGECLEMD